MSQLEGFPFIVANIIREWLESGDDVFHIVDSFTHKAWVWAGVDDVMDVLIPLYHFHGFHEVWSEILSNCLRTLDVASHDESMRGANDVLLLVDVLALTFVQSIITGMNHLDECGFGYARRLRGGEEQRFGYPDPTKFDPSRDLEPKCMFPWHYASAA